MKRDMDLVRDLLIKTEQEDKAFDAASVLSDSSMYSINEIVYHVQLLQAHGLIDANVTKDIHGTFRCVIVGLTWDGHDYLDAIRDERVWQKTKRIIAETVGSTTMGVIKTTAIEVATHLIRAAIS